MRFLNILLKITFIGGWLCFSMIFISMIPYGFEEQYWNSPFDAPPFLWMFSSLILIIGTLIAQMIIRFIQVSKNQKYLKNYGITALAEIISAKPTGSSTNDQPEIEVEVRFETVERREVVAVFRNVFLTTQLFSLQPRMKIFIKYDPKDPKRIMLDTQVNMEDVQLHHQDSQDAMNRFVEETFQTIREGIYTQAVIVAVTPTGKIINGNAEMEIELKVTRPDTSIYNARVLKVLPPIAISKIVVGNVIKVQYSVTDEQNIAIVLSM